MSRLKIEIVIIGSLLKSSGYVGKFEALYIIDYLILS